MPFAIHALEAGAKGARDRRERRRHARPPLPAEGPRPGAAVPWLATPSCATTLRERFVLRRARGAHGAHRRGADARQPGPAFDDHGLRAEWRDLVEYPTVLVGQVPEEFRAPADRGARDGARAPPEVHPAPRRGGRHRPLRRRDERRRRGRRRRSSAAWSAWWWRGCATRRSSWPRTGSARSASASPTSPASRSTRASAATRTSRRAWSRSSRRWAGDGPAGRSTSSGRARGRGAPRQGRPRHAHGPRVPGAAGRDGRDLPRRRSGAPADVATAVRWHYQPVAVEPEAEPAGGLRRQGRRRARLRARWRSPTSSTRWRLLRPRREPDRQQRSLRPAPRGPGRRARAARLLAAEAGGEAARPRGAGGGRVAGYGGLKQPPDAVAKDVVGLPARSPRVRAHGARLRGRRGGGGRRDASRTRSPIRSTCCGALEALQRARRERPDDFAALAEAFKRAKNIVAQAAPGAAVDPKLFEADAERELLRGGRASRPGPTAAYEERLRALAELRAPSTASSTTCS